MCKLGLPFGDGTRWSIWPEGWLCECWKIGVSFLYSLVFWMGFSLCSGWLAIKLYVLIAQIFFRINLIEILAYCSRKAWDSGSLFSRLCLSREWQRDWFGRFKAAVPILLSTLLCIYETISLRNCWGWFFCCHWGSDGCLARDRPCATSTSSPSNPASRS